MMAAALLATACSSSTSSSSDSDETTTSDNTTDAKVLADTYEAFGNPAADTVVVNAQGGPLPELVTDELREIINVDQSDELYVVNVHQAQTLSPSDYSKTDISFEQAKSADTESVEMLADVVEHFKAEGKKVYVLGISFGAFVVQDLLANQGNVADGYTIVVGRLDMPEAVWTEFSEGRTVGFSDGVNVIEVPIEEAGMGGENEIADRNMARLAAGLGHKRYTELLADVDLTNVAYIYGETDQQVGRLSAAEITFLTDKGATVEAHPGGHGEAIDALTTKHLFDQIGFAPEAKPVAQGPVELPDTAPPSGDAILANGYTGALVTGIGGTSPFVETGFELELDPAEFGLTGLESSALPGPAAIAVTADEQLLIMPVDITSGEPELTEVFLLGPEGVYSSGDLETDEDANGFTTVTGTLTDVNDPTATTEFAAAIGIGIGSSTFELDGNRAVVSGTLGARTFNQVEYLIDAHPEVETLVLQSIDGSENDEVNVQTARLVREAGLATLVPADGEIYSGGVDLFVAGETRTAEPGAVLGVHSWCCGPNGEGADEIAQSDPAHDHQTSYFTEMLGQDQGLDLYFFTLAAAPFDGIKNMTEAELDMFDVVTEDTVLAEATPLAIDTSTIEAGDLTDVAEQTAQQLAAATDGTAEVLVVVERDRPTAVIHVVPGESSADDSSSAAMVDVTFDPDGNGGWVPAEATEALVCDRGVDAGLCR